MQEENLGVTNPRQAGCRGHGMPCPSCQGKEWPEGLCPSVPQGLGSAAFSRKEMIIKQMIIKHAEK